MSMIELNTVLGPVPSRAGDIWDAHVHLWSKPYHSIADPDLILQDEEKAVEELELFYRAGGRVVVEFSPYDFERSLPTLVRIARRTQVRILTGCGFYNSPGLDVFFREHVQTDWRGRILSEALHGDEETGVKPAFLKWSTSLNDITPAERESLSIIADVHHQTGLPIATHTQRGTMALEQIRLLKEKGVTAEKILIAHTDMRIHLTEQDYLDILEQGVNASFDQLGKPKYGNDTDKLQILKRLCDHGYAGRIHLATDVGRKTTFKSYGGAPGIAHIPDVFVPAMRQAGFAEELIRTLVSQTPAQYFGHALG